MTRGRVLVIDDDAVVRRMIAKLLRDRGIQVDLVASGEDALAWLEQDVPIDAVLCDLYLPGMSGLAVIESIRARAERKETAIVVLTGRARREMMVQAEALADLSLTKPFSSVDLLETIESVLPGGLRAVG